VLMSPGGRAGDRRFLVKGVLDRSLAAALLLLVGAWLLLIAVAIRLEGPGPVFSRERRVGRYGREFWLLRLRTTVLDVPDHLGAEPDHPGPGVERVQVVTRVGRVVQNCWLDELPKLINVLRGEMSFVGPSPWVPGTGGHLPVKPGLTGLYGRGSRSGCPAGPPMDVDEYVRNYSVALDLTILGRALRAGLAGSDAR